jgi:hypothetical protein
MADIEPVIVEVVKASNRARAPLKKREIVYFANSLIKDGPMAEQVAEFKKQNVSAYATDDHGCTILMRPDSVVSTTPCIVFCCGSSFCWWGRKQAGASVASAQIE